MMKPNIKKTIFNDSFEYFSITSIILVIFLYLLMPLKNREEWILVSCFENGQIISSGEIQRKNVTYINDREIKITYKANGVHIPPSQSNLKCYEQ